MAVPILFLDLRACRRISVVIFQVNDSLEDAQTKTNYHFKNSQRTIGTLLGISPYEKHGASQNVS